MNCKQKLKLEYLAFSNVHLNIIIIIEYLNLKSIPRPVWDNVFFEINPHVSINEFAVLTIFLKNYLLKFSISSLIRASAF